MAKGSDEKKESKLPKKPDEMISEEVIDTVLSEEVRRELDKIVRPDDEESNEQTDNRSS